MQLGINLAEISVLTDSKVSGGDVISPTLASATINAAGTSLTLVFSEAVTFTASTGFALTTTTPGRTVTYASGTGTNTLVYTISSAVFSFETATLDYTQPGNGIQDLAHNLLASFSGASVTNNSTQDVVVAMGFEEYWFGDNAPSHPADGAAGAWNNPGSTKPLTSGDPLTYRSNLGADFNNRAGFQGNGTSSYAEWDRGSTLAQTFSMGWVGAFPAGRTTYTASMGDFSDVSILSPWLVQDTATPHTGIVLAEQATNNGSNLARQYDSRPHCWITVQKGAASSFIKDGCAQIQTMGTNPLNGVTLGRYPGSNNFFAAVRYAFAFVYAGDVTANANYPAFQYWLAQYYGLSAITGTHIWDMGDSRCAGTGSTNASTSAAGGYMGSAASPVVQLAAQATMLMQTAWTGPVQSAGASFAGRTLTTQITDAPTLLAPAIAASVASKKIVMTWNIGSNNYLSDGAVAAYARVTTWVNYVHSLGCYCVVGTIPAYSGLSGADLIVLAAYNALITANPAGADKVVPLAADPLLDYNIHPENFNDAGGGVYIHFNDNGNVVVAADATPILGQSPLNVT